MSELPEKTKSLLPEKRRAAVVGQVVGAFESETASVFLKTAPKREHVLLYVLGIGLLITFVLSAIVKLDRVVVGTGLIVPVGGSLYVSPLDTGIVREVRVKSGDIVHKGQVLATLDPTFTEADRVQLSQKLDSDEAAVQRLEAELAGKPYKPTGQNTSEILQTSIWQKRQAEYRSNLADFDARIRSSESQANQYATDAREYKKRLQLAEGVEKVYEPLYEKGYVSKLQVMQSNDAKSEATRLVSDAQNQEASARQGLQALRAQRESFVQKWSSDIGAELVTVRSETEVTRQNLQKVTRMNELLTLNAPADAVVLKVGKVSRGSIANSGSMNQGSEPLFTLVPLDAPVEIDMHIEARNIGFVKKGDLVHIKLDAYRFLQHGTAQGKITSISEGSFTTDDDGSKVEPYVRVRVAITDARLKNVPTDFRLIPGMTLQGDIMIGSRTILSYLVEGSLRTGAEAMREPL
jgi:HlyD family type I secretion membrane fusion protein